jgi:hypothetical protein
LVILALLQSGCAQSSFSYTIAEPVRLERAPGQEKRPVFAGEGTGNVWTACRAVNHEAMDEMLDAARAQGYPAVSDLEWYDFKRRRWGKAPACRTEYGWFATTIYLFWWPNATKVHVRGRGMKLAEKPSAAVFSVKQVGEPEASDQEIRRREKHPMTVAASAMIGPYLGAGLSVGRFADEATRWSLAWEKASLFGDRFSCDPYLADYDTVSLRQDVFLTRTFYLSAGPAVQRQRFLSRCFDRGGAGGGFRPPSEQRGELRLAGVDVGLGHEWRSLSGFYGGCEWVGGFFGVETSRDGDVGRRGSRRPSTARVLNCRLGLTF